MNKNVMITSFILVASLFFGSTSFAQTKKGAAPVQAKKATTAAQAKKAKTSAQAKKDAAPAQAQQNTNKMNNDAVIRQEVREKAIQTLQKGYELNASCRTPEHQNQFKQLFVSEEAPVYNDLLGLSTATTLTAGKYAKLLGESGVKNTIVTINNISIVDNPYKEGDKWKVDMEFNKRMSYYDKCGIYYNSNDFYHADYNLKMTLIYDPEDKICRIERITGGVDSYAELPEHYFVFKLTDERDRQLYYQRDPLKFNSSGQAILGGVFDPSAFSHANPKIRKLSPTIDDCNIATMAYVGKEQRTSTSDDKKVMIRPNYSLELGDALSVDPDKGVKTSGSGFGIDVGYQFMSTDMVRLSAFGGVGLTISNIEDLNYSNAGDCEYKYQKGENADVDNDAYTRHYKGLNISQEVKLSELTIPVYLDAEFCFSEIISAYADLGLRVNLNMGKDVETKEASAEEIYGVYSQYDNLKLEGDWGFNGFTKSKKMFTVGKTEIEDVKSPIDLIAGAGLRFNIPNSSFAIDLGVGYIMGLSPILENKATDAKAVPNIKYTYDENGGKEQIGSLTNTLESVKHQSLRLNIGLIYKF